MMWVDWGLGSGVIVYGRLEGVAIVLELVSLGSIYSMGPLYDAPRDQYLTIFSYESSTCSIKSGKKRYDPSLY